MNRFLLTLCTLALAAVFASCDPTINPDNENPGNDEPIETPVDSTGNNEEPEKPVEKATFRDWQGEWVITSSHSLTWDLDVATQSLTKTITEEPMSFQVSISEYPGGNDTLLIAGLSFLGAAWPALAKYDPETGKVGIVAGVTMGLANEQGYTATWGAYMVDDKGKHVGYENEKFITYTMTKNGNEATSVRTDRTYETSGGEVVYTVMSTEIYGFKPGSGIQVYTGDKQYPISHFAGDLTWNKVQ